MTLRRRSSSLLLVGVTGLLLLSPAGTAPGQTILVAAKSPSDLADDLEALIKAVLPEGEPMGQALLGGLGQFKSGAILKGLDRGRGFGLAVTLPPNFPEGGPSVIAAAVPVSDLGQLLDSMKDLGLAVDDRPGVAGFSHKVTLPNGQTNLFVLESKGYALFSMLPGGVEQLRALDPSSWKPHGRPETALSVKVKVSELPRPLKDQFLDQLEVRAAPDRARRPGEQEAEHRARLVGQDIVYDSLKSLMRDGDTISMDLDLDRKTSEVAVELGVSARPGTAMAGSLRSLGEKSSRFQGLARDGEIAACVHIPVAPKLAEALAVDFDRAMKAAVAKMDSPDDRRILARFAELVKSNLNAPDQDLGIAIRRSPPVGPGSPHFVVVAGMKVRDGREFERWLRDGARHIKPGENVTITFDVARAADGTAIHRLAGPEDEKGKDAEIFKRFGKAALFCAFSQDVILISFGEAGLEPLRRAVEATAIPSAPGSIGPFAAMARLASVTELAGEDREALRRASAEAFKGQADPRDRVSLGLKGEGDGIRLRLSVDLLALKFASMLGIQTKP